MLPDVNTSAVPKQQEEPVPEKLAACLTGAPAASKLLDMLTRPAAVVLAAALGLGGCGAGPSTGPSTGPAPPAASSGPPSMATGATAFGGTDRAWVEINIAMAEELLPLLELAPVRSRDPQVKRLAAEAITVQRKDLVALYQLHREAGLPAENPHKGMPMPGMVTPEQVAEAAATAGPEFDELLRKHLGAHLDQVVELAASEQRAGVEPRTRALAAEMIRAHREIADQLPGSGT